jgi:hypothetical protein
MPKNQIFFMRNIRKFKKNFLKFFKLKYNHGILLEAKKRAQIRILVAYDSSHSNVLFN